MDTTLRNEITLRYFGNSIGLVIPKRMCELLRFNAGQAVALESTSKGLLIKSKIKKYTLEELLMQCDPKAPMPQDIVEWQNIPAVGHETW